MVTPVVDDFNAVQPDPHTIIRCGVEGVRFRIASCHCPRPAGGETVYGDRGRGSTQQPIEVDRRIEPCE